VSSDRIVLRPSLRAAIVASMVMLGVWADAGAAEPPTAPPFDPGRVGFTARLRHEAITSRVLAVPVLPGEKLDVHLESRDDSHGGGFLVRAPGGLPTVVTGTWRWTAPAAPGLYPVAVTHRASGDSMTLNVFVMVPASEVRDGELNGYRIGSYPSVALRGLDIYRPPRGFIEVTPELVDTAVSPHFTLGQFLCKQESGWPKYLVLRERLLLKLELLLEQANLAGLRCDTFTVMSGYRTPHYNRAIGNVQYSRHLWGGAADIFIDVDPADGVMDDLDRNGAIDVRDAHVLYHLVDGLHGKPWYAAFVGGLGAYRATAAHGPFIHVDARGFRARWGD